MSTWKMPPRAKVYEALTAVADNRVTIMSATTAEVISSSGNKKYVVEWSEDGTQFTSNDNASYWQGYLGYPILAVLLVRGNLQCDKDVAAQLSGISWKDLNTRYRNDYEKAIEVVMKSVRAEGGDPEKIAVEVGCLMSQIEKLQLQKFPRRRRPPR